MIREAPGDWRQLQEAVAEILREAGFSAEVEKQSLHVRGAAELDVYAEHLIQRHVGSLACECKYWKSPVPQAVVQTFRSVLADTGIDAGYIVSSAGFQSGAYSAAKHTNIRLVTWEEFLGIFAPDGPPLSLGLRASAEITGGAIEFCPPAGMEFPWMVATTVTGGHVRRSKEGTLEISIATSSPIPAMQAINDLIEFRELRLGSTQVSLSSDAQQPTHLVGLIEFTTPEGMEGIDPVTGRKLTYPASHCKLQISATATIGGHRLLGQWEAQTQLNGLHLPFPLTGTFILNLL